MSEALWYPFTAMQEWSEASPLTIKAAKGNYLIASDGTQYLDGVASLWTNVHGHAHPLLNAAIQDQLAQVAHTTLLGLSSPPAEQLAEALVAITPASLQHVFYSDSGSTAVEVALKQAFQYWQHVGRPEKQQFVHLDEAYHGDTLGAVAVGGIDLFHQVFGPLLIDTLSIPAPHAYRHPNAQSPSEARQHSLDALEALFRDKADTIAALIVEPLVQGAGGILVHPPGFLSGVAELCKAHEVLLIVDEVATGFGRTGKLFACEHEDVEPDLLCLAKGITGGYLPLAATLSTNNIFEAFLAPRDQGKTFFHGHTYTGNPLACAAALANLRIFEEEGTIAKLGPKISRMTQGLARFEGHPHVGDIRQRGLMVGVELVADIATKRPFSANKFIGSQICQAVRKHGVILRNLGDVIVLMPPLSIEVSEIDRMIEALAKAIEEVL